MDLTSLENAAQLCQALTCFAVPALIVDAGGIVQACNPPLLQLLQLDESTDLRGRVWLDLVSLKVRSSMRHQLQQLQRVAQGMAAQEEKAAQVWDTCLICGDGEEIKVQTYACHLPQWQLTSLILFDITAFRHDEMVLRKTLLEQQAILENAAVGILFSRDNKIIECNIRAAEMLGYTRRQIVGQHSLLIFPSEEAFSELSAQAGPLLTVGHSFQGEAQLKRQNGEVFWCRLYARAIDPWHTAQGTIWIVEDVNAHRQDEEKLKQALLEMRAIMDNAPLAIGFHRDNRILRYNRRYAEMFGLDANFGIGELSQTLYPSREAYEKTGELALPLLLSGQSFHAEMEMRRQDNSLFWANAIAYVVNPEQPQQGTIWIFDDRSAQKAAEEASKKLLLEQKAILDNASIGIMFTSEHHVLRSNPRLDEMLGFADGSLCGQMTHRIFPSLQAYETILQEAIPLLNGGLRFVKPEVELMREDGRLFWASISATAVNPEHHDEAIIWIIEDVTEARDDAREMRRMLMELDAIMSNASVGIVFTKNRQITRFNQRFCDMFGYQLSDVGMPGRDMYPSQEAYERVGAEAAPLLSSGKPYHKELEMRKKDGGLLWVQLIGYVLNPQDTSQGTIWIVEDRTEARAAEESLREALLENQAILESAVIGIAVVENGRTLSCNHKMEELFSYGPGELKGISVQVFYKRNEDWAAAREQVRRDFAAGRVYSDEKLLVNKKGQTFWARLTGRPFDLRDPHGRSVWLVDDITERREAAQAMVRARDELELRVRERTAELAGTNIKLQEEINERQHVEERIHHMAYHDSLTGLPNRALLSDRLHQAMLTAERNLRRLAVMFIDLDRFKTINDTLGHLTGDKLLQEVAQRLCLSVRASDTVSRLGGDEFVVLVPDLQAPQEASVVAQKIIDSMAAPIDIEGRDLHISPSIGICVFPDDGRDVETLMRHADTAMYHAKDLGRNNYQFFTAQMHDAATEQFDLENRLRGALGRDEFVLHFQPIFDMQQRSLQGMEVLLRWRNAEGELTSPDKFIPILEENGLIVPVGEWVIRSACCQILQWQHQGLEVVPLAVNLSPRQFMHRGLIDSIAQILRDTGINPSLLEFEITETALMQHGELTLEILDLIKRMGINMSIDDFGTGYSSLAYLKRFPVHKLKIDRAFVKDLQDNSDDQAIVSAILALAKSLDLKVVAEGVEDELQYAFLRGQGCQYAQGYLLAQPLAESAAAALLGKR